MHYDPLKLVQTAVRLGLTTAGGLARVTGLGRPVTWGVLKRGNGHYQTIMTMYEGLQQILSENPDKRAALEAALAEHNEPATTDPKNQNPKKEAKT